MGKHDTLPVAEPTPISSIYYDELYHPIQENSSSNISVNEITNSSSTMRRNEDLAKVEVAVLIFLFLLTLTGNSIILISIFLRKQKMSRMYYFILHLSLADLTTAFFNILPQLCWELTHRFQGGNFLCKLVKYSQILGPYSSSYILVVTAIDRYQAICFPLSNSTWTPTYSNFMLSLAWAISLLVCVPQTLIFSYQKVSHNPPEYDCWATFPKNWGAKAYVTWYSVTVFVVPLLILIFTYGCITKAIWFNFGLQMPQNIVTSYNSNSKQKDTIDNFSSGGTYFHELRKSQKILATCVGSENVVMNEKVKADAVTYGAFVRLYFSDDSKKQEFHSNSNLLVKQNYIGVLDGLKDRAECSNKHMSDRLVTYYHRKNKLFTSSAPKNLEVVNGSNLFTSENHITETFIVDESVKIFSARNYVTTSNSRDFTKKVKNGEYLLKRRNTIPTVKHKCDEAKRYRSRSVKEEMLVFSNNINSKTSGKLCESKPTSTKLCVRKPSENLNGFTTRSVGVISRTKIKTVKVTLTIICCYVVCSLPFIAAQLWSVYDPEAYTSPFFTGPTFTILTLLASLNSCVNPYVFLLFNPNLIRNCCQRWSRSSLKNVHHKTPEATTSRRTFILRNDV